MNYLSNDLTISITFWHLHLVCLIGGLLVRSAPEVPFISEEVMKKIKLTQGKFALVDDEDFELVNKRTWCTAKSGQTFYAISRTPTKNLQRNTIRMHREILGLKIHDKTIVDHINNDGLDNRRLNIRVVTSAQNCQNRKKASGCSSRFKGVTKAKRCNRQWMAYIYIKRKNNPLGYFFDEKDAARAYNAKAKELWGEFAYLNEV